MTTAASGATSWLAPLTPGIPGVTELDARRMASFEGALGDLVCAYPIGPSVEPQFRSQRLARSAGSLPLAGTSAWLSQPGTADAAARR